MPGQSYPPRMRDMQTVAGPIGNPKETDPPGGEKRTDVERRRRGNRRSGLDRRVQHREMRDTPATFSPDEARAIRKRVSIEREAQCPRCDAFLSIGPAVLLTGGGAIQEARCSVCHRTVMLQRTP
jgi:hypothetical protein